MHLCFSLVPSIAVSRKWSRLTRPCRFLLQDKPDLLEIACHKAMSFVASTRKGNLNMAKFTVWCPTLGKHSFVASPKPGMAWAKAKQNLYIISVPSP